MHRKRRLLKVALKINASLVDELLVLLRAIDLGKSSEDGSAPRPLQVDVHKRIGSREQARSFRRGRLPQLDDDRNGRHHAKDSQKDQTKTSEVLHSKYPDQR